MPPAAWLQELVKGKSVREAMEVTNKAVMEALDGLPPVKVHCSLLAEELSMPHYGIMHRRTVLPLMVWINPSQIFMKVKKKQRKNTKIWAKKL